MFVFHSQSHLFQTSSTTTPSPPIPLVHCSPLKKVNECKTDGRQCHRGLTQTVQQSVYPKKRKRIQRKQLKSKSLLEKVGVLINGFVSVFGTLEYTAMVEEFRRY
uniref:Histone domain-containing protein n=1 Tax=Caenorhabditis tropicalis TaxID=1561998 RepID=A0A1I7UNG8_9PELO